MPLFKEVILNDTSTLYLWKITEDLEELNRSVKRNPNSEKRVNSMKSESHKKGFLSVRMLLQHIGYDDFNLFYDKFGKPHLTDGNHISISHSHSFSAIAISSKPIGLDVEQVKEKILKIASRYMDVAHLENLSEFEKMKKATVIWGIKESIFKIKNTEGISFRNHIFEQDFSYEDKKATATLKYNNKEENFHILFDSLEDYIFVCAFEK